MGNWAEQTISTIDSKTKEVKEKDIRFYRLDEFKRNINRIDDFSKSCPVCSKQKLNITAAVEEIDDAIHIPGQARREYDKLISRISKHMQKEHGFYAPWYFTYLYSFFGITVGFLLGYFLRELNQEYKLEMFLIGFAPGLIVGYLWGFMKDKKVRKEKRIM